MIEVKDVRFDERGLVPAIVQDAATREVLTLAYMNRESLKLTLERSETYFWSRSRNELWHKGATSGHTQRVIDVQHDCDGDALVVLIEPRGPACHTGARSCFGDVNAETGDASIEEDDSENAKAEKRAPTGSLNLSNMNLGATLENLYALVEARRRERPEGSYTTYLFDKGVDKILKKVGEESAEVIIAAKNTEDAPLVAETSDLLYHLIVLLVERGIALDSVQAELVRRRQSNTEEKST